MSRSERLQRLRQRTTSGEARRIRQLARLSLDDVATDIGTDASSISRWERAESLPRGEAAIRYARLLDRLDAANTAAPDDAA